MTLNEYQEAAIRTAIYHQKVKGLGTNLPIYTSLKLAGEAGEVAEKVGKAIRDGVPDQRVFAQELAKELGDVLWYIAGIAQDLGFTLETIGQMNIDKLASRASRGVLSGLGDNR